LQSGRTAVKSSGPLTWLLAVLALAVAQGKICLPSLLGVVYRRLEVPRGLLYSVVRLPLCDMLRHPLDWTIRPVGEVRPLNISIVEVPREPYRLLCSLAVNTWYSGRCTRPATFVSHWSRKWLQPLAVNATLARRLRPSPSRLLLPNHFKFINISNP
jgi:hypothetical protein